MAQSKKLIVICGPTATGKTKLGVALAKALDGEVVSADSMQVYRGMPIGTAQPTAEERDGVPHHMMAMADPSENYSVARYVEEATACVEDIFARGNSRSWSGERGCTSTPFARGRRFLTSSRTAACGPSSRRKRPRGDFPGSGRTWNALTLRRLPACTPTTRSEFYGRWRCGTPPARPSPSTTGRPRPCRRGMRR